MGEPTIRAARPDDVDGIAAIIADRLDPEDADDLAVVVADAGPGLFTVADVDGEAVALATFLDLDLRVGSISIPAVNLEFVATRTGYEGRGLVRRIMESLHDESDKRGDLVQFIVGIPYFYRQFGYDYGLPSPGLWTVTDAATPDPSTTVRTATHDDIGAIRRVSSDFGAEADVAGTHTEQQWRWLIDTPTYPVVVAEQGGAIAGVARLYRDDDDILVFDLAGDDDHIVDTLVAYAASQTTEGDVQIHDRPALAQMVWNYSRYESEYRSYYVRVTDPASLLRTLMPELSRRLPDDAGSGDLLISFYRSSVRMRYEDGAFVSVEREGPVPYPVSAGGSGIPPEVFAAAVFGPLGIAELERREPDVLLGTRRDLMTELFPPMITDILTWAQP